VLRLDHHRFATGGGFRDVEDDGSSSRGLRPSDLSDIELRHAIPGRVRLRIPGIKGQPALAREVQQQLSGLKVVRRVEVSPITGSVLVIYDPADTPAMAELGRMMIPGLDLDGMSAPDLGAEAPPSADAIADSFRQLNQKVAAATGSTDLKVLLPASLFLCGILRLVAARKVPSPTWYDFLWFSFGTFFTLNRTSAPEPAPAAREPGSVAVHANGTPA
jgi:hypothetical protein